MFLHFGAEEQGFIAKSTRNSRKCTVDLGPQDHTPFKIVLCAVFCILLLSFKEKRKLGDLKGEKT